MGDLSCFSGFSVVDSTSKSRCITWQRFQLRNTSVVLPKAKIKKTFKTTFNCFIFQFVLFNDFFNAIGSTGSIVSQYMEGKKIP